MNDLRDALRVALGRPLPGHAAQCAAWPDDLPSRLEDRTAAAETMEPAAVLLALVPRADGAVFFPLIRRPPGARTHAGQISLPGGGCHAGETFPECALREAQEEIGLDPHGVDLLGGLSPVVVPVSGYAIRPFVGWVADAAISARREDAWTIEKAEVVRVLYGDPDRLAARPLARVPRRLHDGSVVGVPAYRVARRRGVDTVWGATAIILAEFLAVWRAVRDECSAR